MRSFREEWGDIKDYFKSSEYQGEIQSAREILLAKPFVLYGAGAEGLEFAKVLEFGKIPPVCFCDKYKSGIEPHTGLTISAPNDLLGKYKDEKIVISSSVYREEIERELLALGIVPERILPRRLLLLLLLLLCSQGVATYEKYLKRSHYLMLFNALNAMVTDEGSELFRGCEQTYDWLSDDKSKEVFIDYLKLCFVASPVKPSPAYMQYFDPVMALGSDETFVDCGAYTGDTAEIFMRNVESKYGHYFAFEPDANNYKKADAFLSDKPNTTLIPKGLWSCETTLNFKDGYTSSSGVSDEGESSVEVTSIDSYFADKQCVPTIIKMDIEGSELEALKGAEQVIREHKPKLAICIYHKPEDLYEIPEIIKSYRDDYKFYIRLYTDTFAELVLYAI
jgi:FkbM family methyltransferase